MTRADKLTIAAGVAIALAVLAAGPIINVATLAAASWPWPATALAMLVAARVGFRAGQNHRGAHHAIGIWRSHRAAIRGGHR